MEEIRAWTHNTKKNYTSYGIVFGIEYVGRVAVIVRALYGMTSSGTAWRAQLAEIARDAGFTICYADKSVWLCKATTHIGELCYEYLLIYTDDILATSNKTSEIMTLIYQNYLMKSKSVKMSDTYLGNEVGELNTNDKKIWTLALDSDKYLKNAHKHLDDWAELENATIKSYTKASYPTKYCLEMDLSTELDEEGALLYLSHIGILRQIVELGCVDVGTEASLLAAEMCSHKTIVLYAYAWLRKHSKFKIPFDPSYVETKGTICSKIGRTLLGHKRGYTR